MKFLRQKNNLTPSKQSIKIWLYWNYPYMTNKLTIYATWVWYTTMLLVTETLIETFCEDWFRFLCLTVCLVIMIIKIISLAWKFVTRLMKYMKFVVRRMDIVSRQSFQNSVGIIVLSFTEKTEFSKIHFNIIYIT